MVYFLFFLFLWYMCLVPFSEITKSAPSQSQRVSLDALVPGGSFLANETLVILTALEKDVESPRAIHHLLTVPLIP